MEKAGNVAIYAIAHVSEPDTICYVGSALDPAKRFDGHRNGRDCGRVKQWFAENKRYVFCYIVEWVVEGDRLNAEAYWYNHFDRLSRLVNSPWFSAIERAKSYTPSCTFSAKEAPCFTWVAGANWKAVSKWLSYPGATPKAASPGRRDEMLSQYWIYWCR